MDNTTIKICFEKELRRVVLQPATVERLFVLIRETFPALDEPFVVKYLDEENELISVFCDAELHDALSQAKSSESTLKLHVFRKEKKKTIDSNGNTELPTPLVTPDPTVEEVRKEVEQEIKVLMQTCDEVKNEEVKKNLIRPLIEPLVEGLFKAIAEVTRMLNEMLKKQAITLKSFFETKATLIRTEVDKFRQKLRDFFTNLSDKFRNNNTDSLPKTESVESQPLQQTQPVQPAEPVQQSQPTPQPQTNPEPQETPVNPFQRQLEQLKEMGFENDDRLLGALRRFGGNIDQVLQELL